jgi:hypothetical protein
MYFEDRVGLGTRAVIPVRRDVHPSQCIRISGALDVNAGSFDLASVPRFLS